MRRVLITGGGGFLGSRLLASAPAGLDARGTKRTSTGMGAGPADEPVELSDAGAVARAWERLQPQLVIHTAYSMDAGDRDIVTATRNVAEACARNGAELIHLSTDLVLDGENAPYDEDAAPAPVHQYGRWKAEAERIVAERIPAAAILRPSLITSFAPPDPRTSWVMAGLRGESQVSLYVDELRCPIAVDDLVAQIWEIASLPAAERTGVWNLVGPEAMSRFALGALIAAAMELPPTMLRAARSAEAPDRRPRDLRLSTRRADVALRTRARPLSELAAASLATTHTRP